MKATSGASGGDGDPDDDPDKRRRKRDDRKKRDAAPRRGNVPPAGPGGAGPPDDPGPPDGGDPEPTDGEESSSSSSESDSDSDDEEEKLHEKEIDKKRKGVFTITSEKLRKAKKNTSRNNMRCDVDKFTRGSDINIVEWIVQMETYFGISSLKPDAYVGFMLNKIALPFFKEMAPFKDLPYLDFREKLVEVFGEPDMATARLHELRRAEQQYGEPIGDYMNRLRLLVMRAHPELSHKERERILVPNFILGLRDHELSTSLTMASVSSSADAERRATEGESARRNARNKRSYSNFLPEPSEVPTEPVVGPSTNNDFEENACAAFGIQRGNRGGAFGGRFSRGRGRGGWTRGGPVRGKCFNCGEAGHYRSECPHPQDPTTFPQPRQGQFQCSICRGPHLARFCPRYNEPTRGLGSYGSTSGANPLRTSGDARVSTTVSQPPPPSGASRLPVVRPPNTQSSTASFFGEEPSMPIFDSPQPAMGYEESWMAALGTSPGNARTALSFFAGNIQNQTYWILVDSGSVRNLIDDRVFDSLPYQPPLRQRDIQIFGGNGGALSIRGFAVLPVVICGVVIWHEFAVVHELPIRAIIGADILQPHLASLSYLNDNQKKLELGTSECEICKEKKLLTDEGDSAQMRYVERNVRELRNRYQIEDGFMAVLPLKEVSSRREEVVTSQSIAGLGSSQRSWPNSQRSAEEIWKQSQLIVDDVRQDCAKPVESFRTHCVEPTDSLRTHSNQTTAVSASSASGEHPLKFGDDACVQKGKIQTVLSELKVSELPVPEHLRREVVEIVRDCIDAFAATSNDFGRTDILRHTINTVDDAQPFKHKLRPIPYARRQFLDEEVERLLAIGAISPADPGACPYASRTVLATKKDGTLRMCVDYRDLNAQTEKDAYPLPRIDGVWPTLSKAKYFASLDLLMGYHQVSMSEKDRYKTAFITHRGLFVYNVMPFGLCNAPATFQRVMEKILGSLVGHGVLVYLDDVLLYAEDAKQLLALLRKVLKLLSAAGLKCKPSKCSLFSETIQYLGHVVSRDGIRPIPVKLDQISQWPRPETGVGLASFLGLCNYYRDLVPSFAHASDELYKASKAKSITWTPELSERFENLKKMVLSAPVVRMPNVDHSFILETDASHIAVGAVLKQFFEDTGLEHPVAFFSRALSGSERNYGAYELEMYAVVRAVEHFRIFLLGKPFLLRTDHAALAKLLRRDLPPTSRVERWILRLSEYVFRIEHQPGKDNVIADVLSRLPFASATSAPPADTNAGLILNRSDGGNSQNSRNVKKTANPLVSGCEISQPPTVNFERDWSYQQWNEAPAPVSDPARRRDSEPSKNNESTRMINEKTTNFNEIPSVGASPSPVGATPFSQFRRRDLVSTAVPAKKDCPIQLRRNEDDKVKNTERNIPGNGHLQSRIPVKLNISAVASSSSSTGFQSSFTEKQGPPRIPASKIQFENSFRNETEANPLKVVSNPLDAVSNPLAVGASKFEFSEVSEIGNGDQMLPTSEGRSNLRNSSQESNTIRSKQDINRLRRISIGTLVGSTRINDFIGIPPPIGESKPSVDSGESAEEDDYSNRDEDDSSSESDDFENFDGFGFDSLFAMPEIDLPIAREGISTSDLETPSDEDFLQAQSRGFGSTTSTRMGPSKEST